MSLLDRIISIFLGLVFFYLVVKHTDKLVEVLNLFVKAAENVADSIANGVTTS